MEGTLRVYCINLKHRTDRWERFSQQPELEELKKNYKFERIEAVNGSALNIMKDDRISLRTKRNIKEHIRRDHEELNSAGGVGCYLSHTSVWKKFLDSGDSYAMILEDDAILYNGFLSDFQQAMRDTTLLPQMPDVWFFNVPTPLYYEYKGKPYPTTVKEQNLGPWVTKTCSPFTGYLLSRNGAEKLLETAFPIDMHVDLYTCLSGELGRVFTVSHRNIVIDAHLLKMEDSDIRIKGSGDCHICNIPTKYERRGMIVISLPIVIMGLAVLGGIYYLGGKKRR
jgi:GR25 family glycosyltransferase involved in LPS biosynthesis